MSTISDQLTLLNNSKQAIKNSINQKGGNITDSTPLADYSTEIDKLPSGGDDSALIDLIERDITSINIPSGTTSIGNYAFYSCTALPSVTIPDSVTSIGDSAFNGCSKLTSINIPDSVTTIGNSSFNGCNSLTSVNIPDSVTTIGDGAFQSCSKLTSINIPDSVTTIGNSSFNGCNSLTSVNIPDSVTSIGSGAFQGCSKLASINIPSGTTSIGNYAFYSCTSLTNVTIPDSVTYIGTSTFQGCSKLTSVTIPDSVTTIGQYAFNGCSKLTSVTVNATTPPTLGFSTFTETNDCPILVPEVSIDVYKAAWSQYADRIYPITQLATVDGNPVYNYEIGNKEATAITDVELEKMPAGTSVEFAEGLTSITAGEINYQEVTLPSTFTSFGDSNQIGSSVTTITSNAVTPPSAFRNQLGGSGLTAIYVPASAVDAYKEDATWSSFASIIQAIPAE